MDHILVDSVEEREDLIDFINYVFSNAGNPIDFKKMIPKVYGDENPQLNAEHYSVKVDGKIKAVVANEPATLCVADRLLKLGLIGSVSVHLYSRGEGYMKELMAYALNKAKANGTDLIALSGLRQRYGYYGFEHGGMIVAFHITKTNMRHCFAGFDASEISFSDLQTADATTVEKLATLYNARPLHAVRPIAEFTHIMQTWKLPTRVILKNGRAVGYCCGAMAELVLENEQDFAPVLKAYFDLVSPEEITVPVAPFETERIAYLTSICEDVTIRPGEMITVLNWQTVLQAFLELKARYTALQDGTVRFAVDGAAFQITVQNGVPTVTDTEPSENIEQLTHNKALMRFFGVQSCVTDNGAYQNWLPLPFWLDTPDQF